MRARCFSYSIVKGEREGDCGRAAYSLVALDSLVRRIEATQGLYAAHLSLVKGKDKATHVCRAGNFSRLKMVDLYVSLAMRAQHIPTVLQNLPSTQARCTTRVILYG
jgi:hypothetical protein